MITAIHKHSILNKDGKSMVVDVHRWANITLTGDTLARFLSEWSEYMDYLNEKIVQNKVQTEEIFEEINVDGSLIQLSVGYRFIVLDPDGYEDHPVFVYWQEQMRLDPNISQFNSPEKTFT